MTEWTDDEIEEMQKPEYWDWDSAEHHPGRRDAQLRSEYRGRVSWTDNVTILSVSVAE